MRLIDDWRLILRRAWSVRLLVLASLLGSAEALLPFFSDAMPRGVFALATVACSLGALVARMVAQPAMREPAAGAAECGRQKPGPSGWTWVCTRLAGHEGPCAMTPVERV